MPNAEYRQTDYGFVLLHTSQRKHDGYFEIFGMIGLGFYELICSCGHSSGEAEELLSESETEHHNKLAICKATKTALS